MDGPKGESRVPEAFALVGPRPRGENKPSKLVGCGGSVKAAIDVVVMPLAMGHRWDRIDPSDVS